MGSHLIYCLGLSYSVSELFFPSLPADPSQLSFSSRSHHIRRALHTSTRTMYLLLRRGRGVQAQICSSIPPYSVSTVALDGWASCHRGRWCFGKVILQLQIEAFESISTLEVEHVNRDSGLRFLACRSYMGACYPDYHVPFLVSNDLDYLAFSPSPSNIGIPSNKELLILLAADVAWRVCATFATHYCRVFA